jgi:hypothetical protein
MMEIVSVENHRTKKDRTSSTRTVRGYILERDMKSSKDLEETSHARIIIIIIIIIRKR